MLSHLAKPMLGAAVMLASGMSPANERVAVVAPGPAYKAFLAMPFDAMRAQYARTVNAGLAPRSMLASRDFERAVDALERMTLGPLARRV